MVADNRWNAECWLIFSFNASPPGPSVLTGTRKRWKDWKWNRGLGKMIFSWEAFQRRNTRRRCNLLLESKTSRLDVTLVVSHLVHCFIWQVRKWRLREDKRQSLLGTVRVSVDLLTRDPGWPHHAASRFQLKSEVFKPWHPSGNITWVTRPACALSLERANLGNRCNSSHKIRIKRCLWSASRSLIPKCE